MEAGDQEMHSTPCAELLDLTGRVDEQNDRFASYITQLDNRVGMMLRAAGETAEHSKNAARDSARARSAAEQASKDALSAKAASEKVAERVYAPINEIVAKYSSRPPPPGELDYGDDAGEITKTQSISAIVKRMKNAERDREKVAAVAEAIERASKLEHDRIVREAAIEKERISTANKLEIERLARDKERARLVHGAIAAFITLATAVATYLASRGH